MKRTFLLTAALLAACSKPEPNSHRESADMIPAMKTADVAEDRVAAPGVDVTAAPGVAFDYRYAFRLPGNRISAVQEAHAQACEKLGIDKCRITGMRYRLVDQKDVEAMLALRLDPKLARQFGKDATAVVDKADGMLVDQEIIGEDVGSKIAGATRSEAELREELSKVEAELARAVPMKGNIAGQAADNFVGGFAAILVVVVSLIPWLLIVGLAIWAFRRARKRFNWAGITPPGDQAGGATEA